MDYPTATVDSEGTSTSTLEDRLRADGGAVPEKTVNDSHRLDASEHDDCDCDDLPDDFPCAGCYIEGRRNIAE